MKQEQMITIIGSLLTIGLAVMFGINGKPTEMGIIVVAGAICLSFVNIDKIQKFKGAGFEAEMKQAVDEANATLDQLRVIATTSTETILTDLMAGNFANGMTLRTRMELHDKLIINLEDIGASKGQIESAETMWKRGVNITFFRGIRSAIKINKDKFEDKEAKKYIQDVSAEFQALLKFEEWEAPTSQKLKVFLVKKSVMNPEIDELLKDYSEFESNGNIRRKNVFVTL